MPTASVTYPARPTNIDEQVTQPSSSFKKEVTKVLGSIFLFIGLYIILMTGAIGLSLLSGYGGIMLIAAWPGFATLMIGIGLIGLGAMVIFFLLKFLFKSNTTDRSHLIEIKKKDQPELFNFIQKLTKETQAPFPKKIYLSADVNACVFYDSSFWSMFLPVRKNLQIGLGLVNCVNLSEFKAILAHEFGHFSQRSMKLGSYVYNVNQVIYNLLYENDDYAKTLQSWGNVNGYFTFFAALTAGIVEIIQDILKKVYTLINKNYMSLSRQMEFHADTVAASVSGSDHLVTSLRRLEVANLCYNRLFTYYNNWYKQNLKPDNLYPQHVEMMKHFAEEHGLAVQHGLPQVTAQSFTRFNTTRVIIKDQWASHPSTADREDHLNKLNIITETVHDSAWILFQQAETLQQKVTDNIYNTVTFSKAPDKLDLSSFQERYNAETSKYSLDKQYKNFFNGRNIIAFELSEIENDILNCNTNSLDEILTESALGLTYTIDGLKTDVHTLEMVEQHATRIETFEFDGKKYKSSEVKPMITSLKDELEQAETSLSKIDRNLVAFFIHKANGQGQGEKMKDDYKKIFIVAKESEDDIKKYIDIRSIIDPIFTEQMTVDRANILANQIRLNEKPIKERLRAILEDSSSAQFYTEDERKKLEEYISKDLQYFKQPSFLETDITLINEATHLYQSLTVERNFFLKKSLFDWQLTFV
ncbi:MAG TPA: M48 family metalloprotease [Chryseolinea sp.]|nr:M48 family metalloprotease [Chryseolinea sp.]HPH45714.1 M48 family metalloprotease [Chryseolinea sp.]HPM29732.1 M48 family metalloprotease [Chryseolinea sp.]